MDKKQEFVFSDNGHTISILPDDLLFVRSSGNYVEIVEKNNTKGHILRSSLKNIENQYPVLYRCHKSYLINLAQIKSISGNTKGYKIVLHHYAQTLPVARDKGENIKKFLSGRLY